MKLYATVSSERGKPAMKGGQEYIEIVLRDEDEEIVYTIRYVEDALYVKKIDEEMGHVFQH